MAKKLTIEINERFRQALDLMDGSEKNVFITGRAGTGKSTLLSLFRQTTKKKLVVLAPTGVAALNVSGQTIHSFFNFRTDVTLQKVRKLPPSSNKIQLFKHLEMIIIDEVSMVRADLFDCIDKFMRLNGRDRDLPFGGVQMIFFGDLYQLPPVVTSDERLIFKEHYASPYFFSAHVMQDFHFEYVELEKIYRQSNLDFIAVLNAIRNNTATVDDLRLINTRVNQAFESKTDQFFITLTATNALAQKINEARLRVLNGKIFRNTATISGDFEKRSLPAEEMVELKNKAQVMLLNNDKQGRWVNGTVGVVEQIVMNEYSAVIMVRTDQGVVEVSPHTWEMFTYGYDKDERRITTKKTGSFTQFPIRLAWAITIHKSQGKTFDRVIIDLERGTFATGQMYVALSRATTLEGIVLKQPVQPGHIRIDWQIVKFVTGCQYKKSEELLNGDDKIEMIRQAINGNKILDIVYLRANDIKSKRQILPMHIGDFEYLGKTFFGLKAKCLKKQEERTFRIDRILEIEML